MKAFSIILFMLAVCTAWQLRAQPALPDPGTSVINSDYGPRNFTGQGSSSVMHKGIDYAINTGMHGLAVEAGQVSDIVLSGIYSSVNIGPWRYMHVLTGSAPNNAWQMTTSGGYNIVIERDACSYLTTLKILAPVGSPLNTVTDPLTGQTLTVSKSVQQGDWVFLPDPSMSHLHLDRGYGNTENPLKYIIHNDNHNPSVVTRYKFVLLNTAPDFPADVIYGNPLIVQANIDVQDDKDLDACQMWVKPPGGLYENLAFWNYTGQLQMNPSEVIRLNTLQAIENATNQGVYPVLDLVSKDIFKFRWNSQKTISTSQVVRSLRYPDGIYWFKIIGKDVTNHQTVVDEPMTLDNLVPYVRKLEVKSGNDLVYSGEWTWNAQAPGGQLVFVNLADIPTDGAYGLTFLITASEPMTQVKVISVKDPATGTSLISVPVLCAQVPNSDGMTWQLTIPGSAVPLEIHDYQIVVDGTDLAGNPLNGFDAVATQVAGNTIPLHQNDGFWSPAQNPAQDCRHHFRTDPCPAQDNSCLAADFTCSPAAYGVTPLQVTFSNASLGSPTEFYWDFGDYSLGTGPMADHTYINNTNETKYFNVALTISDGSVSKSVTRYNYIAVYPQGSPNLPVASFTYEQPSCTAPSTVFFTNTSSGNCVSYIWDFGDGFSGTEENPVHSYAFEGDYFARLIVDDGNGHTSVSLQEVFVCSSQSASAIDFTWEGYPDPVPADESVCFQESVWGMGLYETSWDFGDGTSQSSSFHTFTATGIYHVKLTVTDFYGNSIIGQVVKNVKVVAHSVGMPPPAGNQLLVDNGPDYSDAFGYDVEAGDDYCIIGAPWG